MTRLGRRLKKALAGFLAFCIFISSFSGTAFAAVFEEEAEIESQDILLSLSSDALRQAVQEAVTYGVVTGKTFDKDAFDFREGTQGVYQELLKRGDLYELTSFYAQFGDEYWNEDIPENTEVHMLVRATVSDAERAEIKEGYKEGWTRAVASNSDAWKKTATSSDAEKVVFAEPGVQITESAVEIATEAKESEAGTTDKLYEIVGDEEVIFLFVNRSDYDLTFQIAIDGKLTPSVYVPNIKTLKGEVATASDAEKSSENLTDGESAEELMPGAGGAGSGTGTGGAGGENGTGTGDAAIIESLPEGTVSTEESTETPESQETDKAAGTDATEEDITEADVTAAETIESTEKQAEEVATPTLDDNAAEEAKVEEAPQEAAPEADDSATDGGSDSGTAVSISRHMAAIVGAPVAGEVYEGEAQNPGEEYNLEMGRDADDYGDDENDGGIAEVYDGDANVYEVDATGDNVSGVVYEAVPVDQNSGNGLYRAMKRTIRSIGIGNEASGTAGAFSTVSLFSESKSVDGLFKTTLYDYSGAGTDAGKINRYLDDYDSAGGGFRFGSGDGVQNRWQGGKQSNIIQGIMKNTYTAGGNPVNNFTSANLFPKRKSETHSDVIKVYTDVDVTQMLGEKDEEGYYHYDSATKPVKYKNGGNQLVPVEEKEESNYKNKSSLSDGSGQNGFWPFTSGNFFFGMHLAFDFSLLEDGKVNGEDMVFKFGGDDDVWIYLTEKGSDTSRLALDIGGNHDRSGGDINFATGRIEYYNVNPNAGSKVPALKVRYNGTSFVTIQNASMIKVNGLYTGRAAAYLYTKEDAIARYRAEHPEEISWNWNGDRWFNSEYPLGAMGFERKDLVEYTLDFYYLERGGNGSNCSLEFNTPAFEQDEITLNKRVYSNDEFDKNDRKYDFSLYYKGIDDSKFQKYTEETISLNGNTKSSMTMKKKFDVGTQYYFVENTESVPKTLWSGGTSESSNTSPVYEVGKTNNIVCSNYYTMAPSVGKTAILNPEDDTYQITLNVKGNTQSVLGEDGKVDESQNVYIKGVTAEDPLSQYVEFTEEVPALKLTTEAGEYDLAGKADGSDYQYYDGNGSQVATLNSETNVITWNVTTGEETLSKDQSKSLSYTVKTTEKAAYKENGDYPHAPSDNSGTHSERKQNGYYSNGTGDTGSAQLTYQTTIDSTARKFEFPKPVVRPVQNGTLTIVKKLADGSSDSGDTEFIFDVTLHGIRDTDVITRNGEVIPHDGTKTIQDSIQLKAGELCEYAGLNNGSTYSIEERPFETTHDYYSTLESIKVMVGGNAANDAIISDNKVSGSIGITEQDGKEELVYAVPASNSPGNADAWTDILWDYSNPVKALEGQNEVGRWWYSNDDGWVRDWKNFTRKDSTGKQVPMTAAEIKKRGYTPRYYYIKGDEDLKASKAVVTYTNSFREIERSTLTIRKHVENGAGSSAPTKDGEVPFAFRIEKMRKFSWPWESKWAAFTNYTALEGTTVTEDGRIVIEDAYLDHDGIAQIEFEDADENGTYKIEEVESGKTSFIYWEDPSEFSKNVQFSIKKGATTHEELTCTNRYQSQVLTLTKAVINDGPIDYQYKFKVGLKNTDLTSVMVKAEKGRVYLDADTELPAKSRQKIELDSNGEFTIFLTKNARISLLDLPAGSSYTVEEELGTDDYYDISLKSVEIKNDNQITAAEVINNKISGSFTMTQAQCDLTFTNEAILNKGNLEIVKNLSQEDMEDTTFIFRISSMDSNSPSSGAVFYVEVTVPKYQKTESVTIYNLPHGRYKVEELDHMRYEAEISEHIVTVGSGMDTAVVSFINTKTSNSYFSHTDTIVNRVASSEKGIDGFERRTLPRTVKDGVPVETYALIPDVKNDHFDDDGYDDGDTPLVYC